MAASFVLLFPVKLAEYLAAEQQVFRGRCSDNQV